MAIDFSVKTMAARTRKRFRLSFIFGILTFAAAAASIWITQAQGESPNSFLVLESYPVATAIFQACFSGLSFSVAGTLLAEALKKERLRDCFAAAGFAVGAGLFCLCGGLTPDENKCLLLALAAALLCCALIARSDRPQRSLSRALGCLFICAGTAGLVLLVLLLLTGAVEALFFKNINWQVSSRLQNTAVAISALLAAPFLLFSFLPSDETPPEKYSGTRRVSAWVILPAYLVLLAVLIGYIILILVRWELPVGRMNPYAILALGVFAVLHLLLTGEENRLSRFFVRYGAWLLLPVIVAQAVAVYIRVDAYGLTEARILGLAFSAACLIPVTEAMIRRYGRVFLSFGAVLLVVLAATPLNAAALARLNQEGRLYTALERAEMLMDGGIIVPNENADMQDRKVIWSAASYLYGLRKTAPAGSLTENLSRQLDGVEEKPTYYAYEAPLLFGFKDPEMRHYSQSRLAEGSSSSQELDVAGFSHAKWFRVQFEEDNAWKAELDGETVTLDMILPLADFDAGVMTEPDLRLESGRTLRIAHFSRVNTVSSGVESTYYVLSAWLMTP